MLQRGGKKREKRGGKAEKGEAQHATCLFQPLWLANIGDQEQQSCVCQSGGLADAVLGGQLCPPRPASPSSARAGMKLSVSGGQSQKETAIGIWREWREVFLTWGCVEAVLLDLSIRSLVLKVGLVLCLEPGAAVKAGKDKWLA